MRRRCSRGAISSCDSRSTRSSAPAAAAMAAAPTPALASSASPRSSHHRHLVDDVAEVRVQRRKRRDLCLCSLFKSLKLHSRQRFAAAAQGDFVPDAPTHAPESALSHPHRPGMRRRSIRNPELNACLMPQGRRIRDAVRGACRCGFTRSAALAGDATTHRLHHHRPRRLDVPELFSAAGRRAGGRHLKARGNHRPPHWLGAVADTHRFCSRLRPQGACAVAALRFFLAEKSELTRIVLRFPLAGPRDEPGAALRDAWPLLPRCEGCTGYDEKELARRIAQHCKAQSNGTTDAVAAGGRNGGNGECRRRRRAKWQCR